MLVDLGRNDVGRVARPGTIELSEVMSIEYYSHVMHICSNVTGELAEGRNAFDALRATIPVGTGDRARRRSGRWRSSTSASPIAAAPTAGAVGYIDFSGKYGTRVSRCGPW